MLSIDLNIQRSDLYPILFQHHGGGYIVGWVGAGRVSCQIKFV